MNKKITAIFAALIMVLAIYVPIVAAQDIPTEATVSGAGTPPVIEAIFVLDDSGDLTHVVPGTQILPNPGTGSDEVLTSFWKYAVVSDPNGINDIIKVEEYLTKVGGVDTPLMTTTQVTSYAEAQTILASALAQGVVTQAEYDSAIFKLDPLKLNAKMYKIENSLNNHDMPGEILVHFKAIDKSGGTTIASEGFDYLSIKAIETDFTGINYGSILVGTEQYIAGDDIWAAPGPDGTNRNTIKNQGNIELQIAVVADDMSNGLVPEQFIDASALSIELLGEHVYDLSTSKTLMGMLQPCTPTQISFDIVAPEGTSAGMYNGNINILIA
ncbi:MAG TPA: hypothetical protein VMW20_01060 [Candidatus Nanoarchaeia archaeon]|nr:hypothetical protein [Candidatus Nanoarchaeia archaeon]